MAQSSRACASCGAEVQPDWVVCPHCAHALGGSGVPPPPEAVGVPPPPAVNILPAAEPAPAACATPLTPPPAPPPPSHVRRHGLNAEAAWEKTTAAMGDFETLPDLADFFPEGTTTIDLAQTAAQAQAAPVPSDLPATLRAALEAEPELSALPPEASAQLAALLAAMLRMQAQVRQVEPEQVLREWSEGGGKLSLSVEPSASGKPTSRVQLTSNVHTTLTHPRLDIGSLSLRDVSGEPLPTSRKSGCTVTTSAFLLALALPTLLYYLLR